LDFEIKRATLVKPKTGKAKTVKAKTVKAKTVKTSSTKWTGNGTLLQSPEFKQLLQKLEDELNKLHIDDIDYFVATGNAKLPANFTLSDEFLPRGFCPLADTTNHSRCLCSASGDRSVSCSLLSLVPDATNTSTNYSNAVCHPLNCAKPRADLPVIRITVDKPYDAFSDESSTELEAELRTLLQLDDPNADVNVTSIGVLNGNKSRTFVDVQYVLPTNSTNSQPVLVNHTRLANALKSEASLNVVDVAPVQTQADGKSMALYIGLGAGGFVVLLAVIAGVIVFRLRRSGRAGSKKKQDDLSADVHYNRA